MQYKCIWDKNDDNGTWCSTDVKEDGIHKGGSGNWGFCGPECPHADKPKEGINVVIANVTCPIVLFVISFIIYMMLR